ncbi:inosine/xanthosine triphosphatase [Tardisphaera miroshnichenkoae]
MRVAVGSGNRVKLDAVGEALRLMKVDAEIIPVEVPSGVPDQPICDQTFEGARNRARASLKVPGSDVGIGIEGGVCRYADRTLAYAAVYASSASGKENFAFSAAFSLPKGIVELIDAGMELGDAVDAFFGARDSKHAEGAVGYLTKVISRRDLYVQPVIMALYPFFADDPRIAF